MDRFEVFDFWVAAVAQGFEISRLLIMSSIPSDLNIYDCTETGVAIGDHYDNV